MHEKVTRSRSHFALELDGNVIVNRLVTAESFHERATGLLGRKRLAMDEAMMLIGCSYIHTIGMKFTIDAVFLDAEMVIVDLVRSLKPLRLSGSRRGLHTLELSEGKIVSARLQRGQELRLVRCAGS